MFSKPRNNCFLNLLKLVENKFQNSHMYHALIHMFKSVKFRAKYKNNCTIRSVLQITDTYVPTRVIPHRILKKLCLLGQFSIWNLTIIFCVISFCLVSTFHPITNSILRTVDLGNPGSYLPCFTSCPSSSCSQKLYTIICKQKIKFKHFKLSITNYAIGWIHNMGNISPVLIQTPCWIRLLL